MKIMQCFVETFLYSVFDQAFKILTTNFVAHGVFSVYFFQATIVIHSYPMCGEQVETRSHYICVIDI